MFDELRFNCLFTLNFTQLWGRFVGATNQCCITSQNSTCRLSRGVCRGVSRQLLAKGTYLTPIFVLSYLCLYIRKVKRGSTVLTRERWLQSPKETSLWLRHEGRRVREGLFLVFSACLQGEAFEPAVCGGGGQEKSEPRRNTAVPCTGSSECWLMSAAWR